MVKNMTGKEFLQHIRQVLRELDCKAEQLQNFQNIANKITTVINGIPSVNDRSKSNIENAIVGTMQESDNVEKLTIEFCNLRRQAIQYIAKVPDDDEKLILTYRYVIGKTWAEIANIMGVTLRYTYSLHGNALKSFEKIFDVEDKKAQKSTNIILTNDL